MSSGEPLTPGYNERERFVQEYWLEAAGQVIDASGMAQFSIARKLYTVTLLARLELDQVRTGQPLGPSQFTDGLNELYDDGLRQASERRSLPAPPSFSMEYGAWQQYIHTKVHPCIAIGYEMEIPNSYFELLGYFRRSEAWFTN